MWKRSELSRLVGYQVYGGVSAYTGEYDESIRFASWADSDDICEDEIRNPELRCALRLADAAQRLGVMTEVVAVAARPHGCIAPSFGDYDEVYDNLPSNIFEILERPFEHGDTE